MEQPEQVGVVKVPTSLIKKLRRFLQDFPEFNELINDEESPDYFLAEMLVDAATEYNAIEPVSVLSTIDFARFHQLSRVIRKFLVDLAAVRVLTSVSIRMQRNQISVQGGNIVENLHDKWQYYNTTIRRIKLGEGGNDGVLNQIEKEKAKMNADGAWGSLMTPLYNPYFMDNDFVQVNA